jgi:hypothetical protein
LEFEPYQGRPGTDGETARSRRFDPGRGHHQPSVGIGGGYWSIGTKNHGGTAHFEASASGGGFPQPINFKTERYGGFVQASYIFGAPIVAAKY